MASRLTTNQEIAGSTPAVVIFSYFSFFVLAIRVSTPSRVGLALVQPPPLSLSLCTFARRGERGLQ